MVRTGKDGQLSDEQVQSQVPGTLVHRDLAAFAEFILHTQSNAPGTGKKPPADSAGTP